MSDDEFNRGFDLALAAMKREAAKLPGVAAHAGGDVSAMVRFSEGVTALAEAVGALRRPVN